MCLPENEIKLWLDWVLVLLGTSITIGFGHPGYGVRCRALRSGPGKFEFDGNEFFKLKQRPFERCSGVIEVRTVLEVSMRFWDGNSITYHEEKSATEPFCFPTP